MIIETTIIEILLKEIQEYFIFSSFLLITKATGNHIKNISFQFLWKGKFNLVKSRELPISYISLFNAIIQRQPAFSIHQRLQTKQKKKRTNWKVLCLFYQDYQWQDKNCFNFWTSKESCKCRNNGGKFIQKYLLKKRRSLNARRSLNGRLGQMTGVYRKK